MKGLAGMDFYNKEDLVELLPVPKAEANKYSRGKITLFAGCANYPGAAVLAALASQKAGAGYTEVITAPSSVQIVQSVQASLVVRSWKNVYSESLAENSKERPCAFVVGPGFDETKKNVSTISYFLLGKTKAPLLVDGGALRFVGTSVGHTLCKNRFVEGYPTVITPHGGEAAYLAEAFSIPKQEPAHLAYALSLASGAVTVLKGPQTFVSDGEDIYAVSSGTPALAKAGTGDVLAGMIGAFLAQGMDAMDASVLGVSLHAKAGSLAADQLSSLSVTAEDVVNYIPYAIKTLQTHAERKN